MNYMYYQDLISKKKAEQAAAIKSNQNQCKDIAEEINYLSDIDMQLPDMHNIDISYIKSIDLARLASDSSYALHTKEIIKNEINKITDILDGVLG